MAPKRQLTLGDRLSLHTEPSQASSSTADLSELDSCQFEDSEAHGSIPPASRPGAPQSLKLKKKRTSWVYKHMRDTEDTQHVYLNHLGFQEWRCRYCEKNYQLSGGTLNVEKHLNWHGVSEDAPQDVRIKNQQINLSVAIASAEAHPQKRRRLQDKPTQTPLDGDVVEVLYVKFIAACNQSLRLVECPEFRDFLVYLNEDINTWLPGSHNTIKLWVLRQFDIERKRIKQRLQNARTKIHISCDLWTSPNTLAIFGIVAHYISEDNVLESSVLAIKEVDGAHEGNNLANIVMEVIKDWGFATKLGYFVMDNASNNDSMMRKLALGK
jgi:hypothetical protein